MYKACLGFSNLDVDYYNKKNNVFSAKVYEKEKGDYNIWFSNFISLYYYSSCLDVLNHLISDDLASNSVPILVNESTHINKQNSVTSTTNDHSFDDHLLYSKKLAFYIEDLIQKMNKNHFINNYDNKGYFIAIEKGKFLN